MGKPLFYLSIWESKPRSIMTRKVLGNFAFILKEGGNMIQGEWQNFVGQVLASITACKGGCWIQPKKVGFAGKKSACNS